MGEGAGVGGGGGAGRGKVPGVGGGGGAVNFFIIIFLKIKRGEEARVGSRSRLTGNRDRDGGGSRSSVLMNIQYFIILNMKKYHQI